MNYYILYCKQVTLAAGESTELRLQARNWNISTAQLKGITVTVDGNWNWNFWCLYTNVAKWADLKITYKK